MGFRSSIAVVLAATVLGATGAVAASPRPAGTFVTVEARLGRCALAGFANPSLPFAIEHRSETGVLRGIYAVTSDPSGYWNAPCSGSPLLAKDRLVFTQVGSDTPFRTFALPDVRLTPDRALDRVTGRSPGDPTVDLTLSSCGPLGFDCSIAQEVTVGIDPATKAFRWNLGGRDAKGGWRIEMTWRKSADTVRIDSFFPYVLVGFGTARASGEGAPFLGRVSASLRRGSAVGRLSATADRGGYWSGRIVRNGKGMKVKAGDVASATVASDAVITVPPVSLLLEPGVASGTCFRNGKVIVRAQGPDRLDIDQHSLVASPLGAWGTVLGHGPGWSVVAYCADRRGDVVSIERVAE